MITQFISQIRSRGLARTNRYEVAIPFPLTGTYPIDGSAARVTNLFCDAVQIPGLNIASTPHRIFGESREMPYERNFEPITMSFYVDSGMVVKSAFDKWIAMIINPFTRTIGYYNDYKRDISIFIETVDGQRAMQVVLYEAYPKSVGAIQLDATSKDVMRLSVTWQYKNWLSDNLLGDTTATNKPPIRSEFGGENDPAGIFASNGISSLFDQPAVSEDEIVAVEDGGRV